jgi:hypothetical protein
MKNWSDSYLGKIFTVERVNVVDENALVLDLDLLVGHFLVLDVAHFPYLFSISTLLNVRVFKKLIYTVSVCAFGECIWAYVRGCIEFWEYIRKYIKYTHTHKFITEKHSERNNNIRLGLLGDANSIDVNFK